LQVLSDVHVCLCIAQGIAAQRSHWVAQDPDKHELPPHETPQAPQLFGSDDVLVQTPPQSVCPKPQHTPLMQEPLQALPQLPQLFGSVSVEVQTSPQSASPAGHWHTPPLHT
jgi:hypothetical protein